MTPPGADPAAGVAGARPGGGLRGFLGRHLAFRRAVNLAYVYAVHLAHVLLYDANGNALKRDESVTAKPMIEFSPDRTGSYYVVIYQRELSGAEEAGVAMAVVYK